MGAAEKGNKDTGDGNSVAEQRRERSFDFALDLQKVLR
jgi:hypothetical protein